MTNRYTIGGAAFSTTESLPDLEVNGPADIECNVIFADVDEFRVAFETGALPVAGPLGLVGVIDIDDHRCRILHEDSTPPDRAWLLRQLAPIFSSVLGKLVLHASAVSIDGYVVGFIGETGVGKSTLATHLFDLGHERVSDDLLPIRFAPGPVALSQLGPLPVRALCFLSRESTDDVSLTTIDTSTALKSHIANGFGEHRHPETWATQFDGYHRLVEEVPHYDLVTPDDLDSLPRTARKIIGLITDRDVQRDGRV